MRFNKLVFPAFCLPRILGRGTPGAQHRGCQGGQEEGTTRVRRENRVMEICEGFCEGLYRTYRHTRTQIRAARTWERLEFDLPSDIPFHFLPRLCEYHASQLISKNWLTLGIHFQGLFQIKYLYAKHVYSWDAETLSYYITGIGTTRAVYLLLLLPGKMEFSLVFVQVADIISIAFIRVLKPTPILNRTTRVVAKSKKRAEPTPRALLSEIKSDLVVAKVAAALDLLSHLLVVLAASSSEGLFVVFSMISSLGSGMQPAVQSVALCTLHLREITQGQEARNKGGKEIGKLFGAFSILQAVGSTILSVRFRPLS